MSDAEVDAVLLEEQDEFGVIEWINEAFSAEDVGVLSCCVVFININFPDCIILNQPYELLIVQVVFILLKHPPEFFVLAHECMSLLRTCEEWRQHQTFSHDSTPDGLYARVE